MFAVGTFCRVHVGFAEAGGGNAGVNGPSVAPRGALEVMATVLLAYFSAIPHFPGCLSNASHLYQRLAFKHRKDAAFGTTQEFAETL